MIQQHDIYTYNYKVYMQSTYNVVHPLATKNTIKSFIEIESALVRPIIVIRKSIDKMIY